MYSLLSQKSEEVKRKTGLNFEWRKWGLETEILFSNTVVVQESGCVSQTNDNDLL